MATLLAASVVGAAAPDWRNVQNGLEIPSEGYADQPYVVVTPTGHWVAVLTTGAGREGQGGQHVVSTLSPDQGHTWGPLVDLEPAGGPEASWACPLITPAGRIYAFYTYNGDRVHLGRDDTHGWYVFRYSDDEGRSWSARRRLPLRRTACDTLVKDGRLVQMFWGICKPIVADGAVFFSFTKLGRYFLGDSEGWVFRSDNLLTERDPAKLHWELLPLGDHGIRHPDFGSVQEEHNLAPLSRPGELACVYRTTNGWPAIAYSRDGARTWSRPEPMRYRPGGRIIRHPRACPKIWRCRNGKFLFWCHQHGGHDFKGRNPVWICGGVERDGVLYWSEPEILLYHRDPAKRMSYPDLIEQDGRYWVTETEKETARVHEIDSTLLDGLWGQLEGRASVATNGLVVDLAGRRLEELRDGISLPPLTAGRGGGFTIETRLQLPDLRAGQILLTNRATGSARGFSLTTAAGNTLALTFSDGRRTATWDVDPGLLQPDREHHIVFIVDGGPGIVSCVVDGQFCDGAAAGRQYGWGRFDPTMGEVGSGRLHSPAPAADLLKTLRIYRRPLRISEAVANTRG